LFLLCAEGLSCLIKNQEQCGLLKGVRNGVTGPPISHLLFADDSVSFTRADMKSINSLKSVLKTYSEGSGQRIDLQKSTLFFGSRCPGHIKQQVMDALEVHNESTHSNYFGMLIYVDQSKTYAFNFLAESMWKRV
jgi:hypothetical protein